MFVFRRGRWIDIQIPDYVDPSWGFGDRQKAASIICDLLTQGTTFEDAWTIAEERIYESLGIFRKEHCSPKNKKEENRMKEETHG